MSNMSYCRFENTARDLQDCIYHMEDTNELSKSELRARKDIIEMAEEIYKEYGHELNG